MTASRKLGDLLPATRYAVLAGFASPSLHRLIDFQIEQEKLEVTLIAVAGPVLAKALDDEVQRRTTALTQYWEARPTAPPEPPPIMALRSTIDDVSRGYFR